MFTTTALELTIEDFRIALASVPWYCFRERRRLNKELKRYESKLEEAYKRAV